jgi:hypothetical protein
MIQEQGYQHLHPGAFAVGAIVITLLGAIPMSMMPMMYGHMTYPMQQGGMGMVAVASLAWLILSALIGAVVALVYNVVVDAVTTPRGASSGTNVHGRM